MMAFYLHLLVFLIVVVIFLRLYLIVVVPKTSLALENLIKSQNKHKTNPMKTKIKLKTD